LSAHQTQQQYRERCCVSLEALLQSLSSAPAMRSTRRRSTASGGGSYHGGQAFPGSRSRASIGARHILCHVNMRHHLHRLSLVKVPCKRTPGQQLGYVMLLILGTAVSFSCCHCHSLSHPALHSRLCRVRHDTAPSIIAVCHGTCCRGVSVLTGAASGRQVCPTLRTAARCGHLRPLPAATSGVSVPHSSAAALRQPATCPHAMHSGVSCTHRWGHRGCCMVPPTALRSRLPVYGLGCRARLRPSP
jgi:hypothetical protein